LKQRLFGTNIFVTLSIWETSFWNVAHQNLDCAVWWEAEHTHTTTWDLGVYLHGRLTCKQHFSITDVPDFFLACDSVNAPKGENAKWMDNLHGRTHCEKKALNWVSRVTCHFCACCSQTQRLCSLTLFFNTPLLVWLHWPWEQGDCPPTETWETWLLFVLWRIDKQCCQLIFLKCCQLIFLIQDRHCVSPLRLSQKAQWAFSIA